MSCHLMVFVVHGALRSEAGFGTKGRKGNLSEQKEFSSADGLCSSPWQTPVPGSPRLPEDRGRALPGQDPPGRSPHCHRPSQGPGACGRLPRAGPASMRLPLPRPGAPGRATHWLLLLAGLICLLFTLAALVKEPSTKPTR